MKFYGQLEKAAFEVLSSDPSQGVQGRFWFNSTSLKIGVDDGTNIRYLLRNDGKCIIGNSGTAGQNIRFHRGAASVLQLVTGGDTTAEGSLSTSLAQISARVENYTTSGKPAAGNAGRLYFATDALTLFVDNGSAWVAVGSGGGGGALNWIEDDIAPTPSVDAAHVRIFSFQSGLAQQLYAVVKVPNSYVAGKQIKMILPFYSPDSSGNALLQTVATLIRPGTDTFSSTTNQRTSTNSAVTLGAGTVNIPQNVTFDLTDTSGQINGVAVAANNYIIVKLTRGSDTGTSDLAALVYDAELIFF